MAATGADNKYRPAIYRARGGKQLVIKATATQTVFGGLAIGSGGAQSVKSGGGITIDAGGAMTAGTGSKRVYGLRTATASIALTAAESGLTVVSANVLTIITLPSATGSGKGVNFNIVLAEGALSSTAGAKTLQIRPAAADKVLGAGSAGATDSEVLVMTGANDASGVFAEVMSDGTDWQVIRYAGTWTRAAAT